MCGFQLRKVIWTNFLEKENKLAFEILLEKNKYQDFKKQNKGL